MNSAARPLVLISKTTELKCILMHFWQYICLYNKNILTQQKRQLPEPYVREPW